MNKKDTIKTAITCCPTMTENILPKIPQSQLEKQFKEALAKMSQIERTKFFEETARIATPHPFQKPNLAKTLRVLIDELDAATSCTYATASRAACRGTENGTVQVVWHGITRAML